VTLRRRGFGQGHAYYADNVRGIPTTLAGMEGLVRLPGVTSIRDLLPKENLKRWYGRTAADYCINNWDELAALPLMERHKLIAGAADAQKQTAAARGTAVHRYAEQLVQGRPLRSLEVPVEHQGFVRSYAAFLRRYEVEPIAVELIVINRAVGYCGTADLVAHVRGQVWLLELKTAQSGLWPESALQAAGYEHAETWVNVGEWDDEHKLEAFGIERAGAVWIKPDVCEFRSLDTGPDVWAYFQRLAANWWANEDMKTWIGELIP
jgi:hypothetical protein